MAFRNHYDFYGGSHQDFDYQWENSRIQPFEKTSFQSNVNDQDNVFSHPYNYGWSNDPNNLWQNDKVVQGIGHGWGMPQLNFYQTSPYQKEKSKLEVAMEKMAEASSQFMATSNALQEHVMIIESQRALDFHQPPPPQEEKTNLEDVYTRLDEATRQFVAQQQAMIFPSQEASSQDLKVENENLANISCNDGVHFEAYPSISYPYEVQEQWTQVPSFHEVEEKRVKKVVKIIWDKGEQVVIEDKDKREDNTYPLHPLVLPLPFSQEIQDTSSWRMVPNKRDNQDMFDHLEDSIRAWLVKVAESLSEVVVNLTTKLKAPYAFISPKSIVELRRQHPP